VVGIINISETLADYYQSTPQYPSRQPSSCCNRHHEVASFKAMDELRTSLSLLSDFVSQQYNVASFSESSELSSLSWAPLFVMNVRFFCDLEA
jgi:hypothetical protein